MKLLRMFLCAGALMVAASAGDLSAIKSVYLLPMSSGLDQYLAVRLTAGSVLNVVTDPLQADAVFTDRIGSNFEHSLDDLYTAKPKAGDKEKDKADSPYTPPTMQPLSRGKGALFLVDRKTKQVIWSMYAKPSSSASDDMDHLAGKIVARLDKDRKGK